MSNEITVINDSSAAGWAAAATRTGEVYMSNVLTMVTNVRRKAGARPIDRLNIIDHGNEAEVAIGSDWIDEANFATFEPLLMFLWGKFSPKGFVHLQHCKAGRNRRLMTLFAQAFGVPVYAGTGGHNAACRLNFGEYVVCGPNGTCRGNAGRP